jgi:hypothetical protein
MALNISATMRNLKANSIAYARYELLQASVCQWPHCPCTNSARSARPTATSQWREVRTIQKRLVIRIWKRCVDNTNSYASCASIFTDKICDDPHGFGKKVTGKCFENAFLSAHWDTDGPVMVFTLLRFTLPEFGRDNSMIWCHDLSLKVPCFSMSR